MKKNIRKVLKIIGFIFLALFIILGISILLLRLPSIQNKIKNYAIDFLEDKIDTKVSLDNLYVGFPSSVVIKNLYLEDQASDTLIYIHKIDVGINLPKLLKNNVKLSSIDIQKLRSNIKRDNNGTFNFDYIAEAFASEEDTIKTDQKPWEITIGNIDLEDIGINYNDKLEQTDVKAYFKKLGIDIDDFDLDKNQFELDEISFSNANILANLYLPDTIENNKTENESQKVDNEDGLTVLIDELDFDNIQIQYHNTAIASKEEGIDFNHIDVQSLNLKLENFEMMNGTFAGNIESASIKEKDHLDILKLETKFRYDNKEAYLKDLLLETERSVIRNEVKLSYDDISQLSDNPEKVNIYANIDDASISLEDILNVMPSMKNTIPFNNYGSSILKLDAKATGTLDNIDIERIKASGLSNLKVNIFGNIKNITNTELLQYDITIDNFSSSASTLKTITPPNTIPKTISLPSTFKLSGIAKGTTKEIISKIQLISSDGNAKVDAFVDMKQKNHEKYDIKAHLDHLNVGKIIHNQDLGKISADLMAKGYSFDLKNAKTKVSGIVDYIDYNDYRYEEMKLDGEVNNEKYIITLESNDENANLKLVANGLYNEQNSSLKIDGKIHKINLQQLNFNDSPLIFNGEMKGDFSNINPDELNGKFSLTDFALSDTKDIYPIQNLNLFADSDTEGNTISLTSQIANVKLTGDYKLTEIFSLLSTTVNSYYQFQDADSLEQVKTNQHLNFDIVLKYDDILQKFIPALEGFETIEFTGMYDALSEQIKIDGDIPNITFGKNHIENGILNINTENDVLNYIFEMELYNNESIQLNKLKAKGQVSNDVIDFNITTKDLEGNEQFLIAGDVESLNDGLQISLEQDGLKFNGEDWQVKEGNLIKIDNKDQIYAENFKLYNGESSIEIQTENASENSPIIINLDHFNISTLTEMIKIDKTLASGIIDGTVKLKNLQDEMSFTSDLTIQDLYVYEQLVGTVDAKVKSKNTKQLDINILLRDNGNDLKVSGQYHTTDANIDLLIDISKLQMKSLEGLTLGQIENTEGYLSGKLSLNGTTSKPKITGDLLFNNVGLQIVQTGSDFRNINDKINFNNQGINFEQFTLNDKSGNDLVIDGQIKTENYTDFAFSLDVSAENFKVVDSKEDLEQMMYGTLAINSNLHVGGDIELPEVDGNLGISDITDFTFILPQKNPTLEERKGVVRFVDRDQETLQETIEPDSVNSQTKLKGMDVNVEISIKKEAKITLIIDKATGDFVKLQGNAELTGGIDPSGKTTLVGAYKVEKGSYELNVNMINKKFDIEDGSSITWNGDPLHATLDITANYKLKAPPIDLLQQQLSGLAPSEYNMYKQRIPFNTLLYLKGDLMKPDISFDITVNEDNPSIATSVIENTEIKLHEIRQDESEMNKQVFALLLLNRFIGENPFASEAGMSAETMARQSVSRILSEQLNNIASDLISGVELEFDFDSYEDYSQGEKNTRTDLNVGLSKRLLNDRLKITVGSKFGLEGSARENEELTNIAGDVNIDYMLSKSGRYILRAFRKNEYELALQGQIIETGLGFIITLKYDDFMDIWKKSNENNENN